MNKITGLVYSEETQKHKEQRNRHIERPERVIRIVNAIQQLIKNKPNVEVINEINPCSMEKITMVHPENYFQQVEGYFQDENKKKVIYVCPDTYINAHTANASRVAVAGTLLALDKVVSDEWSNAFAAIRPPGHHAGNADTPNGFCVYNNVAIGVAHLRQHHNIKRICVFDWDVHHGDGTEFLTYDDRDTLVISLHRYDEGQFYPFSGHPYRVGDSNALGYNINIGWNVEKYLKKELLVGPSEYVYAYRRILEPIIKQFNPEVIMISAGFDSAVNDPIGGCEMTPQGYAYLTQKLLEIQSKVVVVLEGGYNLESISNSAQAVFKVLSGDLMTQKVMQQFQDQCVPNSIALEAVVDTISHINQYWPILDSPELLQYEESFSNDTKIKSRIVDSFYFKYCSKSELEFYKSLFDVDNTYQSENLFLIKNELIPKTIRIDNDCVMQRNLLYDMPHASIIKIKLGAMTYEHDEIKRRQQIAKNKLTETTKLGLRLSSYTYKNKSGCSNINISNSEAFSTCNTKKKLVQYLESIFTSNDHKFCEGALVDLMQFVQKLIMFTESVSQRCYFSTCLLLAVDNISNEWVVKWINFKRVYALQSNQKYDKNLSHALHSILKLLIEIDEQRC